ncbi:hypothetical protein [Desulfonatronum lacustre]|uniref:hypothetical protein n=1 Tax=Desulfonatronum lacustre TaxID=66849 RepID=UPI000686FF0E|nr:hypothetical protein [Desulfonatronum lacustre]
MTTTMLKHTDETILLEKGTKILFKELGYTDALRFLSIPRDVREESVRRHRKWQDGLEKDTFFDEVFEEKI